MDRHEPAAQVGRPLRGCVVCQACVGGEKKNLPLLDEGVFVYGLGAPVVAEGSARLRVQISNAHTTEDLDEALAAFARVWPKQAAVSA